MAAWHGMSAAALSLLLPGAGHVLLRRWGRAAIWFAGWIVVVTAAGYQHSAAVLALMVLAALDAYLIARTDIQAAGQGAGARSGRE